MYDDWEWKGEQMVDQLLLDEDEDDDREEKKDDGPEKGMLEQMVQVCLEKLKHQKDGSIRKSELGGFLRYKIGKQYRRGWLKVVVQDMQTKGLVHASASDVFKIQSKGPKWCHFSHNCKYLRDVEGHKAHFKLFVHLCPQDQDCLFLADHLAGKPMTKEALEHFQSWKHKCLQTSPCVFSENHSMFRDHAMVFTHKRDVTGC